MVGALDGSAQQEAELQEARRFRLCTAVRLVWPLPA
jgi:hypothetical protein